MTTPYTTTRRGLAIPHKMNSVMGTNVGRDVMAHLEQTNADLAHQLIARRHETEQVKNRIQGGSLGTRNDTKASVLSQLSPHVADGSNQSTLLNINPNRISKPERIFDLWVSTIGKQMAIPAQHDFINNTELPANLQTPNKYNQFDMWRSTLNINR